MLENESPGMEMTTECLDCVLVVEEQTTLQDTELLVANSSLEESATEGFFYKDEQLAFLWVLLTVIVLGNSLVLASLLHSRARKSRMNFFIAHLAAADLSVGLLSVLVDIGWKLAETWEAGLAACRAIK